LEVAKKRGNELVAKYPSRFQIIYQGDNKMPTMPQQRKALPNGAHILIALNVETIKGQYGDQEEVTCMLESDPDELTRVWITHKSIGQVKAAAAAGLIRVDEVNNSWDVNIGARFQVFCAAGKIVGVYPAPPAAIQNGQ
jgi:hypothetical protein